MSKRFVPEGFVPCAFEVPVPFVDNLEVYYREHADSVDIGAWVLDDYRNGGPMAHGGFLMTLGDIATGHAVSMRKGINRFSVHISFNMNFYTSVPVGAWLEVRAKVTKEGRELVFSTCDYVVDGQVVGHADAVMKSAEIRKGKESVRDA